MAESPILSTSRLAIETARNIRDSFATFHEEFRAVARRAGERFRSQDWHGIAADSRLRLRTRAEAIDRLLHLIRFLLGNRVDDRTIWIGAKAVYSGLIDNRDDWEVAETFYNSITRRVFTTVGVDEEIEFVHTDYPSPPKPADRPVYRTYRANRLEQLVERILRDHLESPLCESAIRAGADGAAQQLAARLAELGVRGAAPMADVIAAPFYRGERAYLVGRMPLDAPAAPYLPMVFCLHHAAGELVLDAVLLDDSDVSLLFSYTRSYFLVDAPRPYDLVQFIKTIVPRKSRAEIYISIGYHKHGKTELYRHALRHLAASHDLYQLAEGVRGMVMIVFTMPSYPVVFKVIKDSFDYPKDCSRRDVIDRYRLVFEHDRAGRLVDAQEYEYLVLDRRRFADELIDELISRASQSVHLEGDSVVIKHCYAERRVTPLDLYLRRADATAARAAVIDYGLAIKDLALTNLFTGDLLLKNFGVTRQERVVFYDYDEICLLTECRFLRLPTTGIDDLDTAGEPWWGVGRADVFPEEFVHFLGLSAELKDAFLRHHADLLTPQYWLGIQQRLAASEIFHVPPYADAKRMPQPHLTRLTA